eukprot:6462827-Amphidinium_carterae.1
MLRLPQKHVCIPSQFQFTFPSKATPERIVALVKKREFVTAWQSLQQIVETEQTLDDEHCAPRKVPDTWAKVEWGNALCQQVAKL